jgi:hypothetical protein
MREVITHSPSLMPAIPFKDPLSLSCSTDMSRTITAGPRFDTVGTPSNQSCVLRLRTVASRPRFSCQVAWWWRGGGASQAELGTSAKGHLTDRIFCIYKYQLATQLESQQDSCFHHSMRTCLLRATRTRTGKVDRAGHCATHVDRFTW